MSQWLGANVSPVRSKKRKHAAGEGAPLQSQETVEAVLNRLSKAYSLAMDCSAAFQRAASSIQSDKVAELIKVGRTARRTFEDAILFDPLVLAHAPALKEQQARQIRSSGTSSASTRIRLAPPTLTSASHVDTVQQLAYLALVNYSDLLLAGCPPSPPHEGTRSSSTLLDQGIVKPLQPFLLQSCWRSGDSLGAVGDTATNNTESGPESDEEETEEVTVRRALVALIDATALDASDPVVWLKLACLARRLNRILDETKNGGTGKGEPQTRATATTPVALLVHRRLERHALERGRVALPSNVPPFPFLMRAWTEWLQEENDAVVYPPNLVLPVESDPVQVNIDLTRYSWSNLVRILLRVTREGSAYLPSGSHHHHHHRHIAAASTHPPSLMLPVLANPIVSIRLSPMLAFPSTVLACICQYLEPFEVARLEATCRAMSYSVLSARTISSSLNAAERRGSTKAQTRTGTCNTVSEPSENNGADYYNNNRQPTDTLSNGVEDESLSTPQRQQLSQGSRASKRLRSQLINEGKRSERSHRRSSAGFCLLSATLGCTSADKAYQELVQTGMNCWDHGDDLILPEASQRSEPSGSASVRRGTIEKHRRQREEARERLSDSSLQAFVRSCGARSSAAPISILFAFVSHVSINVADVFSSDPGGSVVLSSSLAECLDLMLRRCHYKDVLIPSWSSRALSCPRGSGLTPIDLFAIDLLHAELRLKRCDKDEQIEAGFDSDGCIVTNLIPTMLERILDLDKGPVSEDWVRLKCRCFWLIANYYFWRGRISRTVSDSREAEIEGLEYIEKTLNCLSLPHERPVGEVAIPHLDSPSRSGQHWKTLTHQTLVAFRNEIQASSVVLAAQEQFLEASSKITSGQENSLSSEDIEALFSIGDSLLNRYDTPVDSPQSKYCELVDEFLVAHGDTLLEKEVGMPGCESGLIFWFDCVLPTGLVDASFLQALSPGNCSILSILVSCLRTKSGKELKVVQLLSRVVVTIANLCRQLLRNQDSTKAEDGANDDLSDRDDDSFASSDDELDPYSSSSEKQIQATKLRQYGLLMVLLIEKMRVLLEEMRDEDKLMFTAWDGCSQMIHQALLFCSERFPDQSLEGFNTMDDDFMVFRACRNFIWAIKNGRTAEDYRDAVDRLYAADLVRIIIQQRRTLASIIRSQPGRHGRAARQKCIWNRTQLLSDACCEVGLILSTHTAEVSNGTLEPSDIFKGEGSAGIALGPLLPAFCDSLVWLWRTAFKDEASTKDRLLVPVASAITGLCGAAASTNRHITDQMESLDLSLFDSDASALDWPSDDEKENPDVIDENRERLLRVTCQVVHCVSNTFGAVDDTDAISYAHCEWYGTDHGPLLPLIASRVLNRYADRLLVEFVSKEDADEADKAVWLEYPFGTRTTGLLLDSLLYKAYRCLHGFSLVNASDGKDVPPTSVRSTAKRFLPEDIQAAARLYRCITRAYSEGRKSPPKAALDTVLDALPPMEESEKSRVIRKYLFSSDRNYFELSDMLALVNDASNWKALVTEKSDIEPDFLLRESSGSGQPEDEATIVRKGISRMLAEGGIPTPQVNEHEDNERASSSHLEEELGRKFNAIIDDLSLESSADCDMWFKAAQCLVSKGDLIADRLGISNGFCRSSNFYVPERLGASRNSLSLSDLFAEQERKELLNTDGWLGTLGCDMSPYIVYNWCSFSSLQSASVAIGRACNECNDDASEQRNRFSVKIYKDISELSAKKDFARWQSAWGGLFVSSLRKIAIRCLCIALCLAYEKTDSEAGQILVSEISEAIGIILYSELSGAQVYGYPMHSMSTMRKRSVAEAALACFTRAVEVLDLTKDKQERTWDMRFMIGKVRVKMFVLH